MMSRLGSGARRRHPASAMLAAAVAAVAVAAAVAHRASGHGLMGEPRQRGALKTKLGLENIDDSAPEDYWYVGHWAPMRKGGTSGGSRRTHTGWGACPRGDGPVVAREELDTDHRLLVLNHLVRCFC